MLLRILILASAIFAMVACSGGGGGSASSGSTNTVGAGMKAASSSIDGVSKVIPNTDPTLVFARPYTGVTTGLGGSNNIWDGTGWMPDPRCSGGPSDPHCSTGAVTLKYYMGFMFDKNEVRDNGSDINIFGRVKSGLKHACAMATLLGDGTSLPTAGTHNFTFDASTTSTLETYCNFTASDISDITGQSVTVTVTNTTDTTYYDRQISMTLNGQTMNYFIRVNSSTVNIMSAEFNSTNYDRLVLALDRTSGKVSAEYASYSTSSSGAGEWHRLFYDPTAASAAVVGSSYDFESPPNRLIYAVVGKPGSSGVEVAYSVGVTGFGLTSVDATASTANLNYYRSCINPSTGASTTDDTVTCTGVTGTDVSTTLGPTVFTNLMTTLSGGASGAAKLVEAAVVNQSATVPFTSTTDIFTAAVPTGP